MACPSRSGDGILFSFLNCPQSVRGANAVNRGKRGKLVVKEPGGEVSRSFRPLEVGEAGIVTRVWMMVRHWPRDYLPRGCSSGGTSG